MYFMFFLYLLHESIYIAENSKFFRAKATIKFRQNHISLLQDEDANEHSEHHAKVSLLWQAFKKRLGQTAATGNLLHLDSILHKLDNLDALETPFSKWEIDNMIKEMPSDKAPGPDGAHIFPT